MSDQAINIGFLLFPKLTQLDLTGPVQVLSRMPGAKVHLIWKTLDPVPSDTPISILPTMKLSECPQLDVICVPGGSGADDMANDEEVLDFLRKQAEGARYVTSVCTGALVLGAAGLLDGYKATTYWAVLDDLKKFGATPIETRVCVDRNRITGGGVTAGIDFGLVMIDAMVGRKAAEAVQLAVEYNPAPPFSAGSPHTAPADVLAMVRQRMMPFIEKRAQAMTRAAARFRERQQISAQ